MGARRRNARRPAPSVAQRLRSARPLLLQWTHRGLALVALALLGLAADYGWQALGELRVERIVVAGKLEHLQETALREALAEQLQDGFVFLDLDVLRGHLEALPWVYRAQLRRRFPDTLEVRVVEQVPIARWGDDAFLNHEAHVIEVADAGRWAELPVLRGPDRSEARLMASYRRLRQALAPLAMIPVALTEDDFGQLRAELDNDLVLDFGNRDFRERLQRFERLWHAELAAAPRSARHVDLRYAEGAAVATLSRARPDRGFAWHERGRIGGRWLAVRTDG